MYSRGTVHSDAMNYAKRGHNVKLSTCSELVLADVEEVHFESHSHLAEWKVPTENIRSVVEESSASALATSTVSTLKVHKLEKVEVKVNHDHRFCEIQVF